MTYPNWFVCVMGMGTVFFGLVILIIAVTIMGKIVGRNTAGEAASEQPVRTASPISAGAAGPSDEVTPELVAAISAAIVEDMGLPDLSALRIVSIKRV